MKLNRVLFINIIAIITVVLGLYLYKPVSVTELSSVDGLIRYLRSFGVIMPVAVYGMSLVLAIIPAVPFVILCSAAGIIFGLEKGTVIVWAGTLSGASITFFISRKLGYEWALAKSEGKGLAYLDKINGTKGFLVILGLRLLPYFPAPLVNITAGVSRINFGSFFFASALGKIPFIVGYTYLGYNLIHTRNYALMLMIFAAIVIVPYIILKTVSR